MDTLIADAQQVFGKGFMENLASNGMDRIESGREGSVVYDSNGNELQLLPVKELGLPKRYAGPWTKGKHRILVYKTPEEVVWGITAEIVFEFSKIIRK